MNFEIKGEIENVIEQISEKEKKKNKDLNRKIKFIKRYLCQWGRGSDVEWSKSKNPYGFIFKKGKSNV
jgi:hypothetical protein